MPAVQVNTPTISDERFEFLEDVFAVVTEFEVLNLDSAKLLVIGDVGSQLFFVSNDECFNEFPSNLVTANSPACVAYSSILDKAG